MARPRKIEGLEFNNPDYTSQDKFVLDEVGKIMGGLRAHLAGSPMLKPAKLSQLAIDGIRPLMWDDLEPDQEKALSKLIPFRRSSLVEWGDSVIVVGDDGAWKTRERRKASFRRAEDRAHTESLTAAALSRQTGVRVSDEV